MAQQMMPGTGGMMGAGAWVWWAVLAPLLVIGAVAIQVWMAVSLAAIRRELGEIARALREAGQAPQR